MDFLQALERAKSQGLSKDEFKPLWEKQTALELLKEETKNLELKRRQEAPESHNNNGQLFGKLRSELQVYFQQLQNENAELKQTMEQKFQVLSQTVIGEQKSQFQQLSHKILTKVELVQELKVTEKRITDTLSSAQSAFKTSLEGKVDKMIALNKQTDEAWAATLSQLADQIHVKESGRRDQLADQTHVKESGRRDQLADQTHVKESGRRDQLADQTHVKESGRRDLTNEDGEFGQRALEMQREKEEEIMQKNDTPESGQEWTFVGPNGKPAREGPVITEFYDGSRPLSQDFHEPADPYYAPGTGLFADVISHQMSKEKARAGSEPRKSRWDAASTRSFPANGIRNGSRSAKPRNPNGDAVMYIPPDGVLSEISNESNTDFFTEFWHTRPKISKVRLRLWFNKTGTLGVHVLVSKGAFDDQYRWPLVFSGSGEIYNFGSRRYTKIWEVCSQPCHKPEDGQEIPLGASVRLETSRGEVDDITLQSLVNKRYEQDGRLHFKWSLKAEEQK